jgi:SAM-dependent methyltransferase
VSTGGSRFNDYDGFARSYASNNESNVFNALYERPAILGLAGDVRGRRVLDAGCGPGMQAAALAEQGADVTGIDLSEELLAIARTRSAATFLRHDLTRPLPFADGAFDLVLSSLVMHYLEDWVPTLSEFHRVLGPGGRFVFSTHHPFMDMRISGNDDYFGTYQYVDEWPRDGRVMRMRFWHRPLRAMLTAFERGGFAMTRMVEPEPAPELAEASPKDFDHLRRNAQFLLFDLVRT